MLLLEFYGLIKSSKLFVFNFYAISNLSCLPSADAFKRYMLPDINEALTATKAIQQIQPGGDKLLINLSGEKSFVSGCNYKVKMG